MKESDTVQERHPRRAFLVLFLIEIWERFGYYGMASLMVLYMVEHLQMPDVQADIIWGSFSALVYSMPILGGYLGDRVLGARRTLVLGAMTLGAGYLLLSLPQEATFFPSMGLIAVGNGLFKVNPNNLVSRLYENETSKLDVLFTVYYMSLNIGSFVSVILTPWIKDHPSWALTLGSLQFDSWHLAFGLSAIGLTVGLLQYGVFRRYLRPYGTTPDFETLHWPKMMPVIAGSLLLAYLLSEIIRYRTAGLVLVWFLFGLMGYIFAHLFITSEKQERARVTACIIFTVMSIIWAIYNQQIYTSLTLFALRNVRHSLLGIHVAPAQFQDLNEFWLILLALPLARFYDWMSKTRRGDLSISTKYALGFYLLAFGFFLYSASALTAHAGIVSPWWLVGGYAAQSLGELLIAALGFSMVSQLVPERSRGIIMGAWFLGMGVGLYAGGAIASLANIPAGIIQPTATLHFYTRVFTWLGAGALAAAFVATAIIPLLNNLMARPASVPDLTVNSVR